MPCVLQIRFEAHPELDVVKCLFSLCMHVDIKSYFQFSVFNRTIFGTQKKKTGWKWIVHIQFWARPVFMQKQTSPARVPCLARLQEEQTPCPPPQGSAFSSTDKTIDQGQVQYLVLNRENTGTDRSVSTSKQRSALCNECKYQACPANSQYLLVYWNSARCGSRQFLVCIPNCMRDI